VGHYSQRKHIFEQDMNPKDTIRQLVGEAKLKEALTTFADALSAGDNVSLNEIAQLNGQLSNLTKQINGNTISQTDKGIETAKISHSILSFLDIWQQDAAATALERIIYALPIDKDEKLGVLQMVNCDRKVPIRQFKRTFAEKKDAKQPFQFYFLSACPTEMPHSLASRIAYEIMDSESLELDKSVHYPYEEGEWQRIKIQPLPFMDGDLPASRKKFKEYIQDRFKLSNSEAVETFIQTGVPKVPYSHALTVFRITEDKWQDDEGDVLAYLQWLMDTFQKAHPDLPTFIFLFVINIKDLHEETKVKSTQLKVVADLEAFCRKNETAIFRELKPVNKLDIESWLTNLGVDNPNDANRLLTALNQSLAPNDRLTIDDEPRFHMKDVEPIQEKVVRYFRNKA
jgi:hypothetical protein